MPSRNDNENDFPYGIDTYGEENLKPKSDGPLLLGVILLNGVSGFTTVQGAMQILSGPAGIVAGVGIQFMLLILSSGKSARHAPVKKWTAVVVLSTVSIYTSFFSYYGIMTHEKKALTARSLAVNAFVSQKTTIFEPIDTKVAKLAGEMKQIEGQRQKEIKGSGTTGMKGVGIQATTLATDLQKVEKEYFPLKEEHEKVAPYFNKNLNGASPEAILQMAQEAHSKASAEYRGNTPPPNRNDYIDVESSVEFLAPINKLKRGDTDAIAAITAAGLVDGMIIILATAVSIKKRNQKISIENLTRWVAKNLLDAKIFVRTVKDLSVQPVGSMPTGDFLDTTRLENPVHMVSFRLRGRASHFIALLYHNLDAAKCILNHEALLNHDNDTYRIGYRMMLDELRRLRWVVWHRKDRVFVTPSSVCYASFTAWLNSEMVRLAREEARLEAEGVRIHDELERAIVLHFPKA
jgi:hypothetical protein